MRLLDSQASPDMVYAAQWNLDITKGQGTVKICMLYRGFAVLRFFFIYFTITEVKKIVRHTEDFVIQSFHCSSTFKVWVCGKIYSGTHAVRSCQRTRVHKTDSFICHDEKLEINPILKLTRLISIWTRVNMDNGHLTVSPITNSRRSLTLLYEHWLQFALSDRIF